MASTATAINTRPTHIKGRGGLLVTIDPEEDAHSIRVWLAISSCSHYAASQLLISAVRELFGALET